MRNKEQSKALSELLESASYSMNKQRPNRGLEKGDWAMLRWLTDPSTPTPTTKDFAFEYGTTQKYSIKIAGRLAAKGFVGRAPGPIDPKLMTLSLSSKARELFPRDPLRRLASHLVTQFNATDLAILGDIVETLVQTLIEKGVVPKGALKRTTVFQITDSDREDSIHQDSASLELKPIDANAHHLGAASQAARNVAMQFASLADNLYETMGSRDRAHLEWKALRFLRDADTASLTAKTIATHCGVTPATAGNAIRKLVDRGHVSVFRAPGHSTARILSITTKGLDELNDDPLNQIVALIDECLDEKEINMTMQLAKTIIALYR